MACCVQEHGLDTETTGLVSGVSTSSSELCVCGGSDKFCSLSLVLQRRGRPTLDGTSLLR